MGAANRRPRPFRTCSPDIGGGVHGYTPEWCNIYFEPWEGISMYLEIGELQIGAAPRASWQEIARS